MAEPLTNPAALTSRLQQAAALVAQGCQLRELIANPTAAPAQAAIHLADQLRTATLGGAVQLRGLIEISNHCRNNCLYCGLRRDHRQLHRYRMSPQAIIETATRGAQLGYRTVVLQSGEDPAFKAAAMAGIIREIRQLGLVVTLSLGERSPREYESWRAAGAERYLMRHETADPELYASLHPGQSLSTRLALLRVLQDLDYQVGTGFMVGLPGQSAAMLQADLELLQELQPEMVGIGPFIPHPATPLGTAPGGSLAQTVLMVALARLVLPYALIPATTALGSIDPHGREAALQAGANVVMPNLTPAPYRTDYALYPNKVSLGDGAADAKNFISQYLESLGRSVADGPGHHPEWLRRRNDAPND